MSRVKYFFIFTLLLFSPTILANGGTTDYTGGSGRLYDMVQFVVVLMTLTLELIMALSSIIAIYSATTIYIKMQTGEEGFTKSVLMLVGACVFILASTIVLPSFFGFSLGPVSFSWIF
ncbi:MAG: DUF4134 family protein [Prevotella bivia]|uniref:DUF4134 family protein n=1 Tax=uncultured Prevotella sp. TaxID=159272 RepID=UPI002805AEA9|nr:DUF4134 family protein [uncultured Prevotella sp.]MDU6554915.1 DUF4134 family protein [Prevotella bivia]